MADPKGASFDDEPRQTRVRRDRKHLATEGGQRTRGIDRSQTGKEMFRSLHGGRGRWLEPRELLWFTNAGGANVEHGLREVQSHQLGFVEPRSAIEVVLGVQPQAPSCSRSSGSSRSLGCRGL